MWETAKTFGKLPSEVALFDCELTEFSRFCFNRDVAAFGQAVQTKVAKAATSSNALIAQTQREREWERLMGGDMRTSGTGFADPTEADSPYVRVVGQNPDDVDEVALDDGWMI